MHRRICVLLRLYSVGARDVLVSAEARGPLTTFSILLLAARPSRTTTNTQTRTPTKSPRKAATAQKTHIEVWERIITTAISGRGWDRICDLERRRRPGEAHQGSENSCARKS